MTFTTMYDRHDAKQMFLHERAMKAAGMVASTIFTSDSVMKVIHCEFLNSLSITLLLSIGSAYVKLSA